MFEIKNRFGGQLKKIAADSLVRAELSDAYLRQAQLKDAVLTEADLTRAYLAGADLRGADLRGAKLANAYLVSAALSGADLTGADLTGADLTGADLTGAVGIDLTRAQGTATADADLKIKACAGKPQLDLIPLCSLVGVARVFEYGASKYAPGNYVKGTDAAAPSRYIAGTGRHFRRMQAPGGRYTWESIAARDSESGLLEIDHVIAGLLMLREIAIVAGALPEDPKGASK